MPVEAKPPVQEQDISPALAYQPAKKIQGSSVGEVCYTDYTVIMLHFADNASAI